jgi:hypothetical protein
MAAKVVDTKITSAACGIDLADDAAPDEPMVSAGNNFADELVAGDASISHVTADQFEIRAANAGKTYAYETFARCRLRIGIVVAQGEFAVEVEGTHQIGAAAARASTLKQKYGEKHAACAIQSVDLAAVLLSELDLTVELDLAVEDSDLVDDSDLADVSDLAVVSDFVDESEVLDEPLAPPLPAVESVEDSVFEPERA